MSTSPPELSIMCRSNTTRLSTLLPRAVDKISSTPSGEGIEKLAPSKRDTLSSTPHLGSMVSREWVVPPRPKPGRKLATDTPPEKRKVQNRAAQRAFRERRAALVSELAGNAEAQREENELAMARLTRRIQQLELELDASRTRCAMLEASLESERKGDAQLRHNLMIPSVWDKSAFPIVEPAHRSLPQALSRPSTAAGFGKLDSVLTGPSTMPMDTLTCGACEPDGPYPCAEEMVGIVVGCGACGPGTRCVCLEQAIATGSWDQVQDQMQALVQDQVQDLELGQAQDLKRIPSMKSIEKVSGKRARHANSEERKTDFTGYFSHDSTPRLLPSYVDRSDSKEPAVEDCGTCSNKDFCIYAGATADKSSTIVAPTEILMTEEEPTMQAGGCDPGSCAQCVSDPKCGLFCRSLAASLEQDQADGGKSRRTGSVRLQAKRCSVVTSSEIGVSCADTYKTLASHHSFDAAADDIGSWIPKLKPMTQAVGVVDRAPIEVEAASIMAVLKEFDVRFTQPAVMLLLSDERTT